MRFNELIAGVRGDLAVKVFGDEFEPMLQGRQSRSPRSCARRQGAADVKVEQAGGLSVLEITVDKAAICAARAEPRRGAGGDRHRDRRPRGRLDVRRRPPLSRSWCGCRIRSAAISMRSSTCRCRCRRRSARRADRAAWSARDASRSREGPNQISRENGKRRVVVTANVRDRDIASVVERGASARIDAQVKLPPGYWIDLGRAVRKPGRRRATA